MNPHMQDGVIYNYEELAPCMSNAQAALIAAAVSRQRNPVNIVTAVAEEYLKWLNEKDAAE